jgi:transposase
LPGKFGVPGRSARDQRRLIDAVLFVLKSGVPWRDLHEQMGSWNSVWRRFDRSCNNGIWETVVKEFSALDLEELQPGGIHRDLSVSSRASLWFWREHSVVDSQFDFGEAGAVGEHAGDDSKLVS